jgi:hypothetical protein
MYEASHPVTMSAINLQGEAKVGPAREVNTAMAGEQLELSIRTVRRHLRRGVLGGVKVLGRWRVAKLSGSLSWEGQRDEASSRTSAQIQADLCLLRSEVQHLRHELEGAEQERAELRQLVAQAQALAARALSIPAIVSSPMSAEPRDSSGRSSFSADPAVEPALAINPVAQESQTGRLELDPLAALLGNAAPSRPPSESHDPRIDSAHAHPDLGPPFMQAESAPEILDSKIAERIRQGWVLITKLDVRAEMGSPGGRGGLYLEQRPDGAIYEQAW